MKVIVVRQPWAWLIVNGFKDIENRSWATHYRGPLLIQASASRPTRRAMEEASRIARKQRIRLPDEHELGGIVGIVRLGNCVTKSRSPWFEGPIGWELSNSKKLPFVRLKGRLGIFEAPKSVLSRLKLEAKAR